MVGLAREMMLQQVLRVGVWEDADVLPKLVMRRLPPVARRDGRGMVWQTIKPEIWKDVIPKGTMTPFYRRGQEAAGHRS